MGDAFSVPFILSWMWTKVVDHNGHIKFELTTINPALSPPHSARRDE